MHWYLLHTTACIIALAQGYSTSEFVYGNFNMGLPEDFGFGLGGTYIVWLSAVLALYLPCLYFSRFKKKAQGKMVGKLCMIRS